MVINPGLQQALQPQNMLKLSETFLPCTYFHNYAYSTIVIKLAKAENINLFTLTFLENLSIT